MVRFIGISIAVLLLDLTIGTGLLYIMGQLLTLIEVAAITFEEAVVYAVCMKLLKLAW